jgi:hypothetical protein
LLWSCLTKSMITSPNKCGLLLTIKSLWWACTKRTKACLGWVGWIALIYRRIWSSRNPWITSCNGPKCRGWTSSGLMVTIVKPSCIAWGFCTTIWDMNSQCCSSRGWNNVVHRDEDWPFGKPLLQELGAAGVQDGAWWPVVPWMPAMDWKTSDQRVGDDPCRVDDGTCEAWSQGKICREGRVASWSSERLRECHGVDVGMLLGRGK